MAAQDRFYYEPSDFGGYIIVDSLDDSGSVACVAAQTEAARAVSGLNGRFGDQARWFDYYRVRIAVETGQGAQR